MKCKWHLCSNEVTGRTNKQFCCKRCGLKYHVSTKRLRLKQKAVAFLGGKCSVCGYDKSLAALQFHHRNPSFR